MDVSRSSRPLQRPGAKRIRPVLQGRVGEPADAGACFSGLLEDRLQPGSGSKLAKAPRFEKDLERPSGGMASQLTPA